MPKNPLIDFETRKSVHINLTRETHAALRSYLFKQHLSMQEVFEELARQIVEEQPHMLDTLSDISLAKRQRVTKKLSSTDAESIFKVIEESNPLGINEEDV
jgi:hypothetical protein